MKKLTLLIGLFVTIAPSRAQTLFTYGSDVVTKDEFIKAYNKNKTPVEDQQKALREYLDLYAKFKLKVKVAESLRLDTLEQLRFDMQNFRSQVAEGYMTDEKGMNDLVDEALQRSSKDIHLLHFSIPVTAGDSTTIYTSLTALSNEIKTGAVDMQQLQQKFSAFKIKDLGFITALSLPYDIENIVYKLKPGEVSQSFRTKSNLHIFKNVGERKSSGRWKIAQILVSLPPSPTEAELKLAGKKADSIYALLNSGADFKEMVKQFSDDKLTYVNGGELAEFGTGKFDANFESKVFSLKEDGEISKPILTAYGYHIVKRLGHRDIPVDKKDDAFVATLKQQIMQDSRVNTSRENFLKEIKRRTGFKRNLQVTNKELFRYADSVAANPSYTVSPLNNKIVLMFTKSSMKGKDWLNFIRDYKLNPDVYKNETNSELLDKFISTSATDYYRNHLEEYNKEFKQQMQEFKEGNMLFEIMERQVWSRASNDSIGLKQYYNANRSKYIWAESADILLFNCTDEKIAASAIEAIEKGKNWRLLAEESDGRVQADSGRYEIAQLQLPEGVSVREGVVTKPVVNSGDNTTSFIKVLRLFPANQQRSFEESRGLVINDYQAAIEDKWIAALKRKYPVKINEAVFQSLLQ